METQKKIEISTLADNLDQIIIDQKTIYLVGTAHISQSSVDLVAKTIGEVSPDSVVVELCQSRFDSVKNPERWKSMDLFEVIRTGKTYVLMAQLMLSSFQRRLGDKLNVKPGAEMLEAIKLAESNNHQVILGDRDVTVTLRRTWGSLSFWSCMKLFASALAGIFDKSEVSSDEIERLKSSDALEEAMKEFSEALPEVRSSLIDERDLYLAAKIRSAPGDKIVAVVGAGHVPGIKRHIGESINLAQLEIIPKPSKIYKSLMLVVPALLLFFVVYGFFSGGLDKSFEVVGIWSLVTGATAALGATLALAHPLSILAAFVAAPVTTVHPLLASGWVAGLVEAWLRKPKVSDFESVADDLSSLKGLWKNRISRILLVVALTNLVGSLGMFLALKIAADSL
jgi:pheromone shutdown-related protein TraB